jgi:uncharacterized protein YbaP (TraB family)
MHAMRRLNYLKLSFVILALYLVLPVGPSSAEIYRWQDDQGNWHFSDSPTSEAPIQEPPIPSYQEPAGAPASTTEAPVASPTQTPNTPSAVEAVQGGLLWRISRSGLTPSYLLGTIHSADPRVLNLRPAVQQALDRSDRFIMEMQMEADALLSMGVNMMLTDGSTLETLIGQDLYRQVLRAMADYGFPEMMVGNLKPWAVMALLSMPKPTGEQVLDMVLYQQAKTAGKPTAGLETAQEQLAVFEGLSIPDQIALLKMTLAQLPELPRMFERLIQAYTADDLQQIASLAAEYNSHAQAGAGQRFMVQLNDSRNRRMAERMAPYLQQGNSFIAVGALHLTGQAGLIRLLQQRGYAVTPVR